MSEHHEHDCGYFLGSLSDYCDGVLPTELCQELEAHIVECDNCRVVVNTLSKTVMLYRRMPSPDVPHDVKERLYKVLDMRPKK